MFSSHVLTARRLDLSRGVFYWNLLSRATDSRSEKGLSWLETVNLGYCPIQDKHEGGWFKFSTRRDGRELLQRTGAARAITFTICLRPKNLLRHSH